MERQNISLDGAWQFRHDSGVTGVAMVPGPWQAQFAELRHAMGRAWYGRKFTPPSLSAGQEAVLRFGAVSDRAVVRVNGVELARHEGGYLPFEAVLPAGLVGEALLEVECHLPDSAEDFAEIPHGKQSWYGPIGGIWQSVSLQIRARQHLRHAAISARNSGQVSLVLDGQGPAELTILDPAGQVVAQGHALLDGPTEAALTVENPRLWGPEDPALYVLTVALPGDVTRHRFGFREFVSREGKFFLNGKPFYMRAALDQDYYPETIATPPSEAYLEDQFAKAKALGLNLLRCHIKIPDPRYYEVADRMGLLVWTEIPNVAQLTAASAARLKQAMEGILARDGNHPCIVIWTLINEDWGTRLCEDGEHRAWLARTFDWLKQRDPGRLVVDNSPCHGNFHVKSDINDYHYYRSIPERRAEWDALTAEFADGADWTYSPYGDAQRRGDEPLVVSEFGVWGLPDPKQVEIGGAEPWWMETGGTWGDGAAYPHGVQHRFADLRLASTFGSFDGFIAQAQAYQAANLKYEIESIRAHAPIQGYVITEFTDVHWESNGLLDMNRNLRSFHAEFARVNAEVVIVPQVAHHAGWAGDVLPIGLAISSGGRDLAAGVIEWAVEGQAGSIPVAAVPALSVSGRAELALRLPGTGANRMLRVDLTYRIGGQVVARNHVDLGLYQRPGPWPKVHAPEGLAPHLQALGVPLAEAAEADLRLVQVLDPGDVAALQSGARVLLCADGSKAYTLRSDLPRRDPPGLVWLDGQPGLPGGREGQLPNMNLVARHGTMWRGDWIAGFSWIRRDGAFAALPGGPVIDVSYDRVVPHHVLTGFRTWEFGGPIQAGVVVGWVHKPAALIAERRIGRGRLLATTFRLFQDPPGQDPVATVLLHALLTTAAGLSPDPGP